MRKNLLVLLSVAVGLMVSASLSASARGGKEANKDLEALWADLYKDEPAASNAVLKLFKQPEKAVPFLKAKLRPLKLEAERCKRLLKDLGSKDEKVWKAAWDELDYLDPRLAIDLETLMKDVSENPARSRMVELCSQRDADSLAGEDVRIKPVGDDGFNFSADSGSWWAEHRIDRVGAGETKRSWTRAARGISILEQIGSADAIKALQQMAVGHPDAFPTKAAKDSLKRLNKDTKESTRAPIRRWLKRELPVSSVAPQTSASLIALGASPTTGVFQQLVGIWADPPLAPIGLGGSIHTTNPGIVYYYEID